MSKNSKNKEKDHSKLKWFIQVFITTFILSICFSYISTPILYSTYYYKNSTLLVYNNYKNMFNTYPTVLFEMLF